jgi:NAD-dependent deacetylase
VRLVSRSTSRAFGTASSKGMVFDSSGLYVRWMKDVGDEIRPEDEVVSIELDKVCVSVTGESLGLRQPVVLSRRLVGSGEVKTLDAEIDWFEFDTIADEERNVAHLEEADRMRQVDYHAEYAARLLMEGEPERALLCLSELPPSSDSTYRRRLLVQVVALRMIGDLDEAAKLLDADISKHSTFELRFERANLHLLKGELVEAEHLLKKNLSNCHDHDVLHCLYSLACVLLAKGTIEEARKMLELGLEKKLSVTKPSDVRIRLRMQSVLCQLSSSWPFVLRRCNAPVLSLLRTVAEPFSGEALFLPASKIKRSEEYRPLSIPAVRLARLIRNAKHVVAVTGSGISVESGLRTRMDLWNDPKWSRDRCVSVAGFHAAPAELWTLVQSFLSDVPGMRPTANRSHFALAQLERAAALRGIVTQNVDELHQQSGSSSVVELHGSLNRVQCRRCGTEHGSAAEVLQEVKQLPPVCPVCRGPLRPDVVLFGEVVQEKKYRHAAELLSKSDLVLVIGTNCDVAPTSDLLNLVGAQAQVFELALGPSLNRHVDYAFYGNGRECGDYLQQVVSSVVGKNT